MLEGLKCRHSERLQGDWIQPSESTHRCIRGVPGSANTFAHIPRASLTTQSNASDGSEGSILCKLQHIHLFLLDVSRVRCCGWDDCKATNQTTGLESLLQDVAKELE